MVSSTITSRTVTFNIIPATIDRLQISSGKVYDRQPISISDSAYAGDIINQRQTDYREIFEIVRDCNIVIENLEGRTSTLASDVLAAAYAMKGICYYNLIRDFCDAWDAADAHQQLGMPLVDKFDIMDMSSRASLAQTASYTEALLDNSLKNKMSDGKFFFTEYIVKAYQARLAFWTEDWSKTISICNDIIDNSGITLTDISGYEEMIQSQYDKKGEVIVRSHINNSSELDWYFMMRRRAFSVRFIA